MQCSGDGFLFFNRLSWILDAFGSLDASECLHRCPSKESMASHWQGERSERSERSDQDETALAEHKRRRRNSNGVAGATGLPRGVRKSTVTQNTSKVCI